MEVIILKDKEAVSKKAARIIRNQVNNKSNSVLGLATGSTPIGIYENLVRYYQEEKVDFRNVITFNLDEYVGLDPKNENSYISFMKHHLFNHVNISDYNINIPSGLSEDFEAEAMEYERKIASFGGVDIQLLGIGHNGHIGFNEPGSNFKLHTHVINLNDKTIEANKRFFDSIDDVPKQAVTMGIKTIFSARKILLVALGEGKKEAVNRLLNEEISPDLQASILHLHPDVTILLDVAAASGITSEKILDQTNVIETQLNCLVTSEVGLHSLPASQLASVFSEYDGEIKIVFNHQELNAKDFMNIIKLGIKKDEKFKLKLLGTNNKELISELNRLSSEQKIIKVL